MKRKFGLVGLVIVILFCLTACSSITVKSESEIVEDLSTNKYMLETYPDYTVEEVTIIKRQTDVDNNIDKVYVEVIILSNGKTTEIEGHIDLILDYGLYDNGWVLDKCESDENGVNNGAKFIPLTGMEFDNINNTLFGFFGDKLTNIVQTERITDLENGIDTYYFTADDIHKYCMEVLDIELVCYFDSNTGYWDYEAVKEVVSSEWDINGTYYYSRNYFTEYRTMLKISCVHPEKNIYLNYADRDYAYELNEIVNVDEMNLREFIYEYIDYWEDEIKKGYGAYMVGYSYYDFEYAVNVEIGNVLYAIFIGKDNIAVWVDAEETYDKSIEMKLCELIEA